MPADDPPAGGLGRRCVPAPRLPLPPTTSWPRRAATNSTNAWLTRLDLPEPDTPVTVVNAPSGKAASSSSQVVARDPRQAQPTLRRARRARRGAASPREKMRPRPGSLHVPRVLRAGRCRVFRRRARRAAGPTSTIQSACRITSSSCSTTKSELPEAFSRSSARNSASVSGGMQPRRRFVEHVHDAEKIGAHLRGQPQPLQLAGRKRGRAAFQGEVAQPEVEQDRVRPSKSSAMRRVTTAFSGCLRSAFSESGAVPSA